MDDARNPLVRPKSDSFSLRLDRFCFKFVDSLFIPCTQVIQPWRCVIDSLSTLFERFSDPVSVDGRKSRWTKIEIHSPGRNRNVLRCASIDFAQICRELVHSTYSSNPVLTVCAQLCPTGRCFGYRWILVIRPSNCVSQPCRPSITERTVLKS